MYGFVKLSEERDGKNFDLLSLVPSDCVRVLKTDNLEYFVNEYPQTSYAEHLDSIGNSGVVNTILKHVLNYSSEGAHRLGNQMNHLLISFHDLADEENVVVYFRMSKESKRLLAKIFAEKEKATVPKRESYRGEDIVVLPHGQGQFMAVYSGKGFLAVSYQKRLIEKVIDAYKDETSLGKDPEFMKVQLSKSANYMTIYDRSSVVPFVCPDSLACWNEFDIHLNSEVFYLSGRMYADEVCMERMQEGLKGMAMKSDNRFLMVAGQQQVDSCISEAIVSPHDFLFDECVSTLSREASFILVADLDQVAEAPEKYADYLPTFVKSNLDGFKGFILSVQATRVENRISHILVFTYKN